MKKTPTARLKKTEDRQRQKAGGGSRKKRLWPAGSGKGKSLNLRKSLKPQGKACDPQDITGTMGVAERWKAFGQAAAAAAVAAYTFYRSWTAFGILMIAACAYPRFYEKTWKEKRRRSLELQFKEAIRLMSGSLSAGYSAENAIGVSCRELEQLYGSQEMIVREFRYMMGQMEMNRPVEAVIEEFAGRSGLEEIQRFSQIFQIAKRSGGQLVPIICHTVSIMEDQSQVKEEIRTMTASVRFEQKVMSIIPFVIILYIDITSPGFFRMMYETLMGRGIMSGCLAVYLLSCYLSEKILDIQIT